MKVKPKCSEPMTPQMSLDFRCGCGVKLDSLEAASLHAKNLGHSITIAGCLSLQKARKRNCSPFSLDCREFELNFVCGDGFTSCSLEKAAEHVTKTKHVLHVYGRVNKRSSSHKKRGSGRHLTVKVPRPSKPKWRLEG